MKYDEQLKVYGEYLAYEKSLPASATTEYGDGLDLNSTQGALEVVAQVNTALSIPEGKVLTIKLQQSSDDGVSDAYADLVTLYTVTGATGGSTVAVDTILGRYTIAQNAEKYIRAAITVDGTSFTGKVNIYPAYLAR